MAWLLFLDESGHDHKQMPYEVRGGIAIQDSQLWPFTRAVQQLEKECFGCNLSEFQLELKGSTLLDKKRFKFANQAPNLVSIERQKNARSFLMKGFQKQQPNSSEFCAYGQACIEMVRGIFQLCRDYRCKLFASMIPRGTRKSTGTPEEYLRKDQVFLLERFFYFLEEKKESGILIMDGSEKNLDRKFVRQLEAYFTRTNTGRYRTQWVVPSPYFVASDMAYPIQVADICIYCLNWTFRLPNQGMTEPVREEIHEEFHDWLMKIQFQGDGYKQGQVFKTWGVCFTPNPYASGRDAKA
jgi:hypothetical protein